LSTSGNDYIDYPGKASEIGFVEGEQLALTVCQHRRHDVGVVDLAATKGELTTQICECAPNRSAVF
jgi:hypothetical protein